MSDILKLVWFDAKLERFAEVFRDILEAEDIEHLLSVAPKETAQGYTVQRVLNADAKTPAELFNLLDTANTSKLSQELDKNPADFETARAFFRFVNDAYLWEDLEDLERWEEELAETIGGNPTHFKGCKGEGRRSAIFFDYCRHLGNLSADCVEIVEDTLTNSDTLGFYLGLF